MAHARITVLLIEDNPGDARLIGEMLAAQGAGRFDLSCVGRLTEAAERLAEGDIDLVLLDLSLPDSEGLDTLATVQEHAPHVAVVVLTGTEDETLGLEAVQQGAQDYLVKGQVDSAVLARAARYAIERKQASEKIRALNADLERRVNERTQELAAANEELRHLDRLKTAFIDVITHELTTPLTVASGMMALAQRRLPDDQPKLSRTFDTAHRAVKRLQQLMGQIVEVAGAGDFATPLHREPTAPADLAQVVVADVAPFVELRDQSLCVEVPDDLPRVPVEHEKIRDVLVNLVMNAVKFTPDGGTITLAA